MGSGGIRTDEYFYLKSYGIWHVVSFFFIIFAKKTRMKLKKRGKKLFAYLLVALLSFPVALISWCSSWYDVCTVSLIIFVFSVVKSICIYLANFYDKYGLLSRQGPDTLFEYEPGDKEYEEEKKWQP